MSFEEKNVWVYATVALVVPVFYFTGILGQLASTDATEIEYFGSMLTAVIVAIVISIVASILIGIFSPRGASVKDERDKAIARLGNNVGFILFSALMVVPLGMAIAELPHFWIANVIYLAFTLTAFVYSVVMIVAYRRGV